MLKLNKSKFCLGIVSIVGIVIVIWSLFIYKMDTNSIYEISEKWASALSDRDGKTRYELIISEKQEEYYNSIVKINGEEEPWTIGVSSPYVVSRSIEGDDLHSIITYTTTTSDSIEYIYQEELFFVKKDNKFFVNEFKVHVNYLRKDLYDEALEIQNNVDNGIDEWRLIPENVAGLFINNDLRIDDSKLISSNGNEVTFSYGDKKEITVKLYRPIQNDEKGFLAVYEYTDSEGTYLIDNNYIAPKIIVENNNEFVFSSNDKVIESAEEYMQLEYPLLASLEEENLFLYGDKNKNKLILVNNGNVEYLTWLDMTPRGILPKMYYEDFDNDGIDELLIDLYVGSGTGVSFEEIHIVEINEENHDIYSLTNTNYIEKIQQKLKYGIDKTSNIATIWIDNEEYEFDVVPEAKEITFGSIAFFEVIDNRITLRCDFGVISEDSIVEQYYDENYIEFEVLYKDGDFELSVIS